MKIKQDAKPLYQPWNEDTFRDDRDVQALTFVQRAIYKNLCNEAFFGPWRPYLPADDDKKLCELAWCDSMEQWMQNKAAVMRLFDVKTEKNGLRLVSRKRIVEDWERIAERRAMLAEYGKLGGRPHKESDQPEKPKVKPKLKPKAKPNKSLRGGSIRKREKNLRLSLSPANTDNHSDLEPSTKSENEVHHLVERIRVVAEAEAQEQLSTPATFSQRSLADLRRLVAANQWSEEEIRWAVLDLISHMDEFQLRNAGSHLATNLSTTIEAARQHEGRIGLGL